MHYCPIQSIVANSKVTHNEGCAKQFDFYHKQKVTKRRLPLVEIFNSTQWHQSVKRLAMLLYDVCASSKDKTFNISQEWMARKLKLTRTTINVGIKALERYGLIKVFRRDLGLTHIYQFVIPPWLEKILQRLPNFNTKKGYKNKQVLNELTLSNTDLSAYKDYTEFKDSKSEKIRIFRSKNPEKAKELEQKYTTPESWTSAHTLWRPKDVIEAPREVAMKALSFVKDLLKRH